VLSLTRIHARSKGHGVATDVRGGRSSLCPTDVRGGEVFTVRNELIVHVVNFLDRDAARREADLG
jgi:hypothetical protein